MTRERPLILVHGWAGSFAHTWERAGIVELLREAGRSLVDYDLPGHGTSHKSHEPDDYRGLEHHLVAAVSQHTVVSPDGAVDAVGFSLGAITLLRAMLVSPSTFGTVILAGIGDGVFQPHEPSRSEKILAGLEGRADPGDVTARIFGKIGNEAHNDPAALAAVLRRPRENPLEESDLSSIANLVIVAIGDKDFSAPATRLAAAFPNGSLVTLKGVDHFRTPESMDFIDLVISTFG